MPWFKVDDNLAFHHKVVAAGNPAMGLWCRAGSLCAQQLTDGFIPDHMISALGTRTQAERLVACGLWEHAEGGYKFHGWGERQPSRDSVEADRAAAADRMRAYRARRKGAAKTDAQFSDSRAADVTPNERRTSGEVREKFANPDPTRPDPTHITTTGLTPAEPPPTRLAIIAGSSQRLIGEWIDHCPEPPPGRVKGQVAKEIKTMLDEGIPYERVRSGLAEWNTRGLHPSVLPSVVHELGNRKNGVSRRQAETNGVFDRAMERARAKEAERG